ncbi:RluA family pseudouridine synthase [Brevibacillus sp. TJ4]|uniref:RluA family pseudouridine synthase n=1 Tax=Brevibacillus sp. TJ4 TaxID=3234853 RepID=UPI0037D0513E
MREWKKQGEWLVTHLSSADADMPIGNLLREQWKLPRKQVHLLFQHKEVSLDKENVAQHVPVQAGQELRLRLCPPEPYGVEPAVEPLEVLYEDDHLLIVYKPAGVLLHPTQPDHQGTLDHLVAGHFARTGVQAKVRHVHRLDQDTSGVVLYAKHAWASALLDEQLRLRTIKRTYLAFVHGHVERQSGKIDKPIGKDRNHPSRRRVTANGDTAITTYEVVERYRDATLLRCRLETGRTHQIRVHLSHIGHPLIGDALYGGKTKLIARQALHAYRLEVIHPFDRRQITAEAPLPADLASLKSTLANAPL